MVDLKLGDGGCLITCNGVPRPRPGSFDWVAHGMEAPAGDQSPAVMVLDIRLPPELAMKDVGTDIQVLLTCCLLCLIMP